jgi:hypothetical protein
MGIFFIGWGATAHFGPHKATPLDRSIWTQKVVDLANRHKSLRLGTVVRVLGEGMRPPQLHTHDKSGAYMLRAWHGVRLLRRLQWTSYSSSYYCHAGLDQVPPVGWRMVMLIFYLLEDIVSARRWCGGAYWSRHSSLEGIGTTPPHSSLSTKETLGTIC